MKKNIVKKYKGWEDEKVRYTRYNYKKKKNNDILKFILSFIGMSVFVIIVGILLANIIIHFLPLNNAGTAETSNKNKQVQRFIQKM